MISVITQVAILRRVRRNKVALRDRQAAVGGRKEEAGALLKMTWGWKVDEEYREGKQGFAKGERRM